MPLIRIYWKIHDFIKILHRRKFTKLPSGIYYDRMYREWVASCDPYRMYSDRIEYVIEDLCGKGLYYPFRVNMSRDHEHNFGSVLLAAFRSGDNFSLDEWMADYYSQQELEMLRSAATTSTAAERKSIINTPLTPPDNTLHLSERIKLNAIFDGWLTARKEKGAQLQPSGVTFLTFLLSEKVLDIEAVRRLIQKVESYE